ncbi:MAG: sugar transferase [Chitinophagaceae bacterium]
MPKTTNYIALIDVPAATQTALRQCDFGNHEFITFSSGVEMFSKWEREHLQIKTVIVEGEIMGPNGVPLLQALQLKKFVNVPYFILTNNVVGNPLQVALKFGVADVFRLPIKPKVLTTRINFLIEHWYELQKGDKTASISSFKTPTIKRIFDVVFAGTALLLLSPLFLLVIVLLKLESNGPAFYYSLRVGTGYKIFKFFKFRSMYVNADKRLKDLKHLNQYAPEVAAEEVVTNTLLLCDDCKKMGTGCQAPFFADDNKWCEKQFNDYKKANAGSAFFKLKDDPRITKVGKVLRNTSIDELPQLWNVIIGDMSIVGNRPLPLYEAEKLTTDRYSLRFMAPAGITGLWQVEKRGKGEMSEDERLMLDNKYAQSHSFANDIRLILRTIPALFQKENV